MSALTDYQRMVEKPAIARYEAKITALNAMIKQAHDHIRDHAEFAEVRRQDGIEMGAAVWRIALEDIATESRAFLQGREQPL